MKKRLIVFDLDGTLAASKSRIDSEMGALLGTLLDIVAVAVISGGDWAQFETQLLAGIPCRENLRNLALLPTCGTKFYRYEGTWRQLYSENFTVGETGLIQSQLRQALDSSGFAVERSYGALIEDRGSQITFSALGQAAPLDAKERWDPDFSKRKSIMAILAPLLPQFSVHAGGTTSIDITRRGIDKGYGIRKLRDTLGIAIDEMVFVGDALFPGGNDYPAQEAGALSIQVRDPLESKRVIAAMLACLEPVQHAAVRGRLQ
jgi:phosphomannomutase